MVKYKALLGEKFDKSKITVVGNPTITSDGVASGFSDGNRILLPNAINFTSDWELRFSFICTNTLVNERIVGSSISGNARLGINIGFTGAVNEENKLMCWLSSGTLSTDAWDIINRKASTTTFQTNQLYYIILQCKNGVYSLKSSTDNINWVTEWTVNSSLVAGTKNLALGCPIAEPNFYFLGSIDLPSFKIYVDNQLVYSPTKPTYLLERRKPKVWNKGQFTVVGNPSISDDGIASGFGAGNYIDINYSINTIDYQNLNIDISFTTSSDVTTNQYILHSKTYAQLSVYIINGQLRFNVGKNNAWFGDVIIDTVTNNTRYNLNLNFTTSGVTYTCETNGTTITNFIADKTMLGDTQNMNLWLGVTRSSNTPFLGSIDLKSFKIYTDNNLVFDGGAETYVYDSSKFTVVGSPTITEYGVASGFSSGNYLNINVDLSNLDILKIKSTFKTPNADNRTNFSAVWQIKSTTSIGLEVINQQMMIIDASGSKPAGQFTYEDDTEYEVIWEYTISNGNWVLNYKKAIDTEFTTKTGTQVDYTIAKQSTLINIGTMNNYYYFTGGQIDLPSISITVDGKEVFTGAKENYYMLNGI